MVTTTQRPVLLGGYAAKSCPRATHNRFDDTVKRPEWTPDPAAQERMDAGRTFEDDVVAGLLVAMPAAADLRPLDGDKAEHVAATLQHLAAGTRLIIGGRLPDDVAGGRTGKPDLLIRGEDRPDGTPGYHVGDIKHHLATERSAGAVVLLSTPESPELATAVERDGAQTRWREDDCMQLAHYWRMLEACGHAAEQPWGAVLGTDGPKGYVPDPLAFVWHDLSAPMFWTFSRSQGGAWRSSLQRYDHEHAFRLAVAAVARRRTGAEDDPAPLVVPIGQRECESCEWAAACVDTLPHGELSRELGKVLSVREYLALRQADIGTVADLATADVESLLTPEYLHENGHLSRLASRLRKAQLNAELAHEGVVLRRRDDAPVIPTGDVEYDVDCEWGRDGHVYLWGVLRTDGDVSTYKSFLDLAAVDDHAEYELLVRFLTWLDGQIAADGAAGRSTKVFYYSSAEITRINRVTSALDRELPELRAEASPDAWVDLLPLVKKSVDSRFGHGLKVVAVHGADFEWDDEDPGGLQSQTWHEQAVAGDAAAEARLLAYNGDDVRATQELRKWLTSARRSKRPEGAR